MLSFVAIPEGYSVRLSLSDAGNPKEKANGKIPPFFEGYING
jgi:hypothetical protein